MAYKVFFFTRSGNSLTRTTLTLRREKLRVRKNANHLLQNPLIAARKEMDVQLADHNRPRRPPSRDGARLILLPAHGEARIHKDRPGRSRTRCCLRSENHVCGQI